MTVPNQVKAWLCLLSGGVQIRLRSSHPRTWLSIALLFLTPTTLAHHVSLYPVKLAVPAASACLFSLKRGLRPLLLPRFPQMRSILKHPESNHSEPPHFATSPAVSSALPYPYPTPQVHFPPSDALTQTYLTHSTTAYDRAPIVVVPNECAMPARGCPGRTYDGCHPSSSMDARYRNANGQLCRSPDRAGSSSKRIPLLSTSRPPALVPDVSSSESDESDGLISPPPERHLTHATHASHDRTRASIRSSGGDLEKALSFLPHAPSPKDREKTRRSIPNKYRTDSSSTFGASSPLDDCLGGF